MTAVVPKGSVATEALVMARKEALVMARQEPVGRTVQAVLASGLQTIHILLSLQVSVADNRALVASVA